MDREAPGEVRLRDVMEADLPIFYEHQRDPDAVRMADFPMRDWNPFVAHWTRILADPSCLTQTILWDGHVAGNVGAWEEDGTWEVGYWLGQEYWGRGIATRALAAFLPQVPGRPLYAHVAQHNIASRRVLEKSGFTVLGTAPGLPGVDGNLVEEVILVLPAS